MKITEEQVEGLINDLREKTEDGVLIWTPFKKVKEKDGQIKTAVVYNTALKRGGKWFTVKVKQTLEDNNLVLIVRYIDHENGDRGKLKLASRKKTPTLMKPLMDLCTAITLVVENKNVPDWVGDTLFSESEISYTTEVGEYE